MGAADVLMSTVGRFILRRASVTDVVDVAPGLRRIHLEGDDLRGARFEPGDKLQLWLEGHGMRTYTPIHWDAERGATTLLGWAHGESPGAAWVQRSAVGDVCRLFGPRRSIPITALGPRIVLFGDETSLGVARAARIALGEGAITPVLEVERAEDVRPLLADLGLPAARVIERRAADGHLGDLARSLSAELDAQPGAALVMTGRAQAIQAMRARLGPAVRSRRGKTKAYWSLGRAGLD